MKEQLLEHIHASRIVPVVVIEDAADALPLADALLAAGLRVIEITFRTAAAVESIRRIAGERPEIYVGAGTLLTSGQVKQAAQAGAKFGVAPGLSEKILAAA